MLRLHFSNRLPALTAKLLSELQVSERGVFDVDDIIVPNLAVRRSLQLSIAASNGICANVQFDNLGRWLWRMVARVIPDVDTESPFHPASLVWHVLSILKDPAFTASHPRLVQYLAGADDIMRYELAANIAGLFDQYITYRSDWLEEWAAGTASVPALTGVAAADVLWQSALWRALLQRLDAADRHPRRRFIQALQRPETAAQLPKAVHIVALPSISPLHVEWLAALARHLHVHLYVLNPCAEYWAHIVDRRQLVRLRLRGEDAGHEVGNPLLAAWAGPTREYFSALINVFGDSQEDSGDDYVEPTAHTRLHRLQNSILHLEDLPPGSLVTEDPDRSVEIHVCHSMARQLEVVTDRLLSLFSAKDDASEAIRPSDVLIAVPDLEAAAPLVDAVFAALPDHRRIPYTITGRARTQTDTVARTVCDLLTVAASRLEADAVWALLDRPMVARRFGLDADRLEPMRDWIAASGFRWGLDDRHCARLQTRVSRRHTLDAGMDRLFLAYALPAGHMSPLWDELLPAPGVHDPNGEDLAALDAYVHVLSDFVHACATERTADDWARIMDAVLDNLVTPSPAGDDIEDLTQTRATLRELFTVMARAEPLALHPLSVVKAAIEGAFEDPARGGVPSGAVTVAALSSLRGLSFRVVCILGLDDGVFPRANRAVDFDLMNADKRPGDRQRRADDRNLFLDYVVATRDVLHLSYTGFSDRTNAVLPPSAVLSELLDVVVPAGAPPGLVGDERAQALRRSRDRIVIEHPLQPFSTAHFNAGDPRRLSHNAELANAVQTRLATVASLPPRVETDDEAEPGDDETVVDPQRPFYAEALSVHPMPRELTVADLAQFFRSPAAYFLERRLGITLTRAVEDLPIEEPLFQDWGRDRDLEQRVSRAAIAGEATERLRAYIEASPETPSGVLGSTVAQSVLDRAYGFAERVRPYQEGPPLPVHEAVLEFTIDGSPVSLTGIWSDLRPVGLFRYSHQAFRVATLLGTWIEHLLLTAVPPIGWSGQSHHLFYGELVRLAPVPQPYDLLKGLLEMYQTGLHEPLHFYPKTSFAYASADQNKRQKEARSTWVGSRFGGARGESLEPAYQLALRGEADPLDASFEALSIQILQPLIAAMHRSSP